MNIQKFTQREAVWDRKESTFVRSIHLETGVSLTGYSKKVGRNERRDKTDLLTNWILRDYKNGYLDRKTTRSIDRLDRIEYYKKIDNDYELVIILHYTFADWGRSRWITNKKFFSFINRFYSMIEMGRSISEIVNALEVRTKASPQDPLDISVCRFPTMRDLNAYVVYLKTETDIPHDAIDSFYEKYKQKYFNHE